MNPLISIIIVNFNSGSYLSSCLASLYEQTLDDFEVIIVDNASNDQSLKFIESYPDVKIIYNEKNNGFAAGQNQGMHIALGKYLIALNFDIYLNPDFLAHAIASFENNTDIGTISGKMLRMLPNGQLSEEIDNAGLLLSKRRMPLHRGAGELDHGQYQERCLVFGAMGAAALYRRDMLEDIAYKGQYFDDSFFTWYEDIDLDWRARLRGWGCLYIPEAVAYHVGDPFGHQKSKFAHQIGIRNRWKMILSNECPHCLKQNAIWLLREELALLRYIVLKGQIGAYLKAIYSFIQSIPSTLDKRRWVRNHVRRECLPEYPQPLTKLEGN